MITTKHYEGLKLAKKKKKTISVRMGELDRKRAYNKRAQVDSIRERISLYIRLVEGQRDLLQLSRRDTSFNCRQWNSLARARFKKEEEKKRNPKNPSRRSSHTFFFTEVPIEPSLSLSTFFLLPNEVFEFDLGNIDKKKAFESITLWVSRACRASLQGI